MKYEFKGTPKELWNYEGGDNGSVEVQIGETVASFCRWDKNTGDYVIERAELCY